MWNSTLTIRKPNSIYVTSGFVHVTPSDPTVEKEIGMNQYTMDLDVPALFVNFLIPGEIESDAASSGTVRPSFCYSICLSIPSKCCWSLYLTGFCLDSAYSVSYFQFVWLLLKLGWSFPLSVFFFWTEPKVVLIRTNKEPIGKHARLEQNTVSFPDFIVIR